MRVSVVLCTYSPEMVDHFTEAAESVLSETSDDVELVIVVDGDEELCRMATRAFGESDRTIIHCDGENPGCPMDETTEPIWLRGTLLPSWMMTPSRTSGGSKSFSQPMGDPMLSVSAAT